MRQKNIRVVFIALFMLCFLCGCGKKTKEYVLLGIFYFREDAAKEEKQYIIANMRAERDENNNKKVEDIYLNDAGDVVMVMTEQQRKAYIQSNIDSVPMLVNFINGDEMGLNGSFTKKCMSYNCDDEMTEMHLYFASREAFEASEYDTVINGVLSLMFEQQILNGESREDIQATLYIEFIDTGDVETSTYRCDDLPIAKTTD